MEDVEFLIKDLPAPEAARRFLGQFGERHPAQIGKLLKNKGLLSDVLTLVAYSPLLATTLLQNPEYVWWLGPHRLESKIRDKEELLESLARFALTNSEVPPQVLLARFRRRELLRIFLRDIRRLATITEVTEEISNLADAILEHALRLARQEMDNRYGIPLETDAKGRARRAELAVVSLGKLGSKELNYSSDIDLLFVYSAEGATSGGGARGAVTNREYFVKLAELMTKIVGEQTGEGAAYRVDLRLRPHGRVGALALSLKDTANYYQKEARPWERQVLIRSRASAGDAGVYKGFFAAVENFVFSKDVTIAEALADVRSSKEKIDRDQEGRSRGFNVKLGRGGVREIEFIAQALQLAHGGRGGGRWLRSPHSLITLARLADRNLLGETELTELFEAYEFLRRAEHLLQMENGLQTHLVPAETEKLLLLARRMGFPEAKAFEAKLNLHAGNVSRIFRRVFDSAAPAAKVEAFAAAPAAPAQISETEEGSPSPPSAVGNEGAARRSAARPPPLPALIAASLEKSDLRVDLWSGARARIVGELAAASPYFAEVLAANPGLIADLPDAPSALGESDYRKTLLAAADEPDLARRLAALRKNWTRFLLGIAAEDIFEKLPLKQVKRKQTELAEASVEAALLITARELGRRFSIAAGDAPFAVLGLGKLGGRGMDYGSDLDLVLAYDDEQPPPPGGLTRAEFYGRAVETFVAALSAMTREGQLYRVDLRLRPDGKNGATSIGKNAFLDYLETRAAVWEWLAYVKLRGVAGAGGLADEVEARARETIHRRAREMQETAGGQAVLRSETRRIREKLEEEKSLRRRGEQLDIKFGAGGMLDVYFATRFLQLRDGVADADENRSTDHALEKLYRGGSLSRENFEHLLAGYEFLSALDHRLRLTVGRSTRLPLANQEALRSIAARLGLASTGALLENLTFHRLAVRAAFENILRD